MVQTFRKKPSDAYGYAIVDAVNTLLVHEQMQKQDRGVYHAFGAGEEAPPMRTTLGSRVAKFLVRMTRRSAAAGSAGAGERTKAEGLDEEGRSGGLRRWPCGQPVREQTGRTHGGLYFSRTPTQFWHEAPGMLRDVDMSGCYNNVIAKLNVYWAAPSSTNPGTDRSRSWKRSTGSPGMPPRTAGTSASPETSRSGSTSSSRRRLAR